MSQNPNIPSELRMSRLTDLCVEQFIVKAGTGVLTCGLASFVLFGTKNSRLAFTTLGLGFGLGDAYRTCSTAFDKESNAK